MLHRLQFLMRVRRGLDNFACACVFLCICVSVMCCLNSRMVQGTHVWHGPAPGPKHCMHTCACKQLHKQGATLSTPSAWINDQDGSPAAVEKSQCKCFRLSCHCREAEAIQEQSWTHVFLQTAAGPSCSLFSAPKKGMGGEASRVHLLDSHWHQAIAWQLMAQPLVQAMSDLVRIGLRSFLHSMQGGIFLNRCSLCHGPMQASQVRARVCCRSAGNYTNEPSPSRYSGTPIPNNPYQPRRHSAGRPNTSTARSDSSCAVKGLCYLPCICHGC